ncbi:MAG TPA: MBL fold metallo-hydrolase [Salinarimonas sp.]|nr:MBL fold metallo-hydrolase [Salinarimonas sp.]
MTLSRRTVLAAGPAAALAAGAPAMAQQAAPAASPSRLPAIYRLKVGDAEVVTIHDGSRGLPLTEQFVRNASLPDVQAAMERAFLPKEQLDITFTPVVVRTGRNLAVIDTGFADNGPPTAGGFLANLPTAGIDPSAVDTVLISHFHGDHISGMRRKDGSQVYPNAKVMVPAAEWAFWMDDARMNQAPEAMRGSFALARRMFADLGDRLVRFDPDKEVIPGITAVATPGHTPGHTSFLVSSGGGRLLVTADISNHPALFVRNPDWSAVFDMDADQARATRRRVLDMAASERMQIVMFHAPFPATGHIARAGSGYEFVPVQWSSHT